PVTVPAARPRARVWVAALAGGFSALPRRYHRPTGQIQQPGRTQDWIKLGGKAKVRKVPTAEVGARRRVPDAADRSIGLGPGVKRILSTGAYRSPAIPRLHLPSSIDKKMIEI